MREGVCKGAHTSLGAGAVVPQLLGPKKRLLHPLADDSGSEMGWAARAVRNDSRVSSVARVETREPAKVFDSCETL